MTRRLTCWTVGKAHVHNNQTLCQAFEPLTRLVLILECKRILVMALCLAAPCGVAWRGVTSARPFLLPVRQRFRLAPAVFPPPPHPLATPSTFRCPGASGWFGGGQRLVGGGGLSPAQPQPRPGPRGRSISQCRWKLGSSWRSPGPG